MLDPQTNRQSFYLEHTDDIVSLDVNPYPKYSNVDIILDHLSRISQLFTTPHAPWMRSAQCPC